MTSRITPREQAYANARAVLDRARHRIARDRATGRLTPDQAARFDCLARQQPTAVAA
ncbi:hypothetical protein ACWENS_05420 [Streptomyces sp. NPDC004532]